MPATVIGTALLRYGAPLLATDFVQIPLAFSPNLPYDIVVRMGVFFVDVSILSHVEGGDPDPPSPLPESLDSRKGYPVFVVAKGEWLRPRKLRFLGLSHSSLFSVVFPDFRGIRSSHSIVA